MPFLANKDLSPHNMKRTNIDIFQVAVGIPREWENLAQLSRCLSQRYLFTYNNVSLKSGNILVSAS